MDSTLMVMVLKMISLNCSLKSFYSTINIIIPELFMAYLPKEQYKYQCTLYGLYIIDLNCVYNKENVLTFQMLSGILLTSDLLESI